MESSRTCTEAGGRPGGVVLTRDHQRWLRLESRVACEAALCRVLNPGPAHPGSLGHCRGWAQDGCGRYIMRD